jgi:tRNA wybutosine-synthesizing protein 1
MSLSEEEQKKMEYSGYRFSGSHGHAGTKICHWTKQSILNKGECYKQKFYGIESHRCLQMSPAIPFCHQKCSFCWRDLSLTKTQWEGDYDDPKTIIDDGIKAQQTLLCGFFGNDKADKKKLEESKTPNNAAISLAGEPTLYPEIDELIAEFKKRDFTTFLVSNGLLTEKLKNLSTEPSQLYISLDAADEKTYKDLCNPQISDAYSRLMETLKYLPSFNTKTCIRTTCVKGNKMTNTE